MSLNELTRYKRNFERYDLVILDDLGYCSFSRDFGEAVTFAGTVRASSLEK